MSGVGGPVPDVLVRLENLDLAGPLGSSSDDTYTDAAGLYSFTEVPAGRLRATAYPSESTVIGVAEGTLTPPDPLTLDITLGNAVSFLHYLAGSDGFRYGVDCNGQLSDGGTVDGALHGAYYGAYFVRLGDEDFPCQGFARLEDADREVVFAT